MQTLVQSKCDLFPTKAKDIMFDEVMLDGLVGHLELKLYQNFEYYNFYDVIISLC
jgi:hypothetical protein